MKRLYASQNDAFKAIENGTFKSKEFRERLKYIKENIKRITRINNEEVKKVELINYDLEWNNRNCKPIIYLDIQFKED